MKPSTKIFGREPAVLLGIAAAAINLAVAYFLPWTQDQVALVNAVLAAVVGVIVAVFTKDQLLAVGLGLIQAVIAVSVGFGFQISADKQSAIMAFAGVLLALYNRQATSPDPNPGIGGTDPAPVDL